MADENEIGFEDEPLGGSGEPESSSGNIQFDGLVEATRKAERRRERRRRRNERTGKIAACVLLVCVIIAIIVAVTFVKEAEHVLYQDSLSAETDSPTLSPTKAKPTYHLTPSPTATKKPTLSVLTPAPTVRATPSSKNTHTDAPKIMTSSPTHIMKDTYIFEPVADTHVYLDGPHKGKMHGNDKTMLVQRGNKDMTLPGQEVTLPTVVSMLEFITTKDWGESTGLPKRSRWPEEKHQIKVTLKLNHVSMDDAELYGEEMSVEELSPINVEIYRLPNNHDWVVESFTGEDFHKAPREATEGFLVTQEVVNPLDKTLYIDVTHALSAVQDLTKYADDQIILLLKIYWEDEPREGDLFETRESEEGRSPQLFFSNMA